MEYLSEDLLVDIVSWIDIDHYSKACKINEWFREAVNHKFNNKEVTFTKQNTCGGSIFIYSGELLGKFFIPLK